MKVTLLKDVLTPNNGVGRVGQTVEMSASQGHSFIKAGLASEAEESTEALPADPIPEAAKPLTHETLKQDKGAKARESKEEKKSPDTK